MYFYKNLNENDKDWCKKYYIGLAGNGTLLNEYSTVPSSVLLPEANHNIFGKFAR